MRAGHFSSQSANQGRKVYPHYDKYSQSIFSQLYAEDFIVYLQIKSYLQGMAWSSQSGAKNGPWQNV
jgi:hypothetical protein